MPSLDECLTLYSIDPEDAAEIRALAQQREDGDILAALEEFAVQLQDDRQAILKQVAETMSPELAAAPQQELNQTPAEAITDTPEFRAWFGDSKVVDENGQPLVVYHGGAADIEAFDTSRETQRGRGDIAGTFFTPDGMTASNYRQRPGGRTYAVYLSLQNPLDITDAIADGQAQGLTFGDAKRRAMEALDREVHDGVVFRGDDFNPPEYVAFRPEQIKSVKNQGTFDPQDGRILYQTPLTGPTPAQQMLRDQAQELGLTPDLAQRVNPIYQPERIPQERLPSNREAALWLESNFTGEPITDMTAELTPEQISEIATLMAAEAQLALRNTNSAFDWYSGALMRAMDVIGNKYPMIVSDAAAAEAGFGTASNARFVFTYIMAVTSQNLDVAANSVATDKAFAQMVERVKNGQYAMLREWGTGDKQEAMGDNFDKFGPMLDAMPGETFPEKLELLDELFRQKMTVSEWEAEMKARGIPYSAPGQTAKDAVVYGSSTLGPKIGNGFWQNLNGNFSPLTIDLWMRRTWGRLTGLSIGNPGALPGQRARMKEAIRRSRSKDQGNADHILAMEDRIAQLKQLQANLSPDAFLTKKAFAAEKRQISAEISEAGEILADLKGIKAPEAWKAEYDKSDEALLDYAKRVLRVWDKEYARLREIHGKKVPADLQPTWARAAKTVVTNLAKPLDQVANGTQRKQIEAAGAEALAMLRSRGVELTTADLQAILWYPEKELWNALTSELQTDQDGVAVVPPSPLNESYDTSFARILRSQGYEVEGAAGDRAGGAGSRAVAGQDGGSQGSGRAQGAGGDRAGSQAEAGGARQLYQTAAARAAGPGGPEAAAVAASPDGQPVYPEDLERLRAGDLDPDFFRRSGWAVVSANMHWGDNPLGAANNVRAQQQLQADLERMGIPYIRQQGWYKGAPDGTTFLIIADEATAVRLGKLYGQESILTNAGWIYSSRPLPATPTTGEVFIGDAAQQQEGMSITETGLAWSLGMDFSRGPGVPLYREGYSEAPGKPQLPVNARGKVELHHWSEQDLTTVDPAFAGSNSAVRGAERDRALKGSFYGINPRANQREPGTGYVRESFLRNGKHYVTEVDPGQLYPWTSDPEGLVGQSDAAAAEQAIRDAGYLGYYVEDNGSPTNPSAPLGNVAVIFEALPVQPASRTYFQTFDQMEDLRQKLEAGATPESLLDHPAMAEAVAAMNARPATFADEIPAGELDTVLADRAYVDPETGEQLMGPQALLQRAYEGSAQWAGGEVAQEGRITILLGAPAAGKSTLAERIAASQRARIIDSDEIKKMIPEYDRGIGAAAVHEESSSLGKRLLEMAVSQNDNIILPKVGDNAAKIEKQVAELRASGYIVDVVVMDVTPQEAFSRMVGRFLSTGRLIPPRYALMAATKPIQSYAELKAKGAADGFAQIDNNQPFGQEPTVVEDTTRNEVSRGLVPDQGGAAADPRGAQADGLNQGRVGRGQKGPSGPLGSIQLPSGGVLNGGTVINLFESANTSTFFHELGHLSLEAMLALSADSNAPQQLRDDMATVRAYLGMDPDQTVPTTEQHETWARSFEAYLMEGKSPSLEMTGSFQRLSLWLQGIYNSVRQLRVNMTPEVREVMDRLLATNEQIAAAQEEVGQSPLFMEAPAGMTESEWKAYQGLAQRRTSEASRKLLDRTMEAVRRTKEAWWKDERAATREAVAEEVGQRQVYKLISALTGQDLGDKARLNKAELVDIYGEQVLQDLTRDRHKARKHLYTEAGASLAEVAETFGYDSHWRMIQDLQGAQPMSDTIEAEVDRRMLEKHGDPLNDGTVEAEALDAVHNEQASMAMSAELRAIAKQSGRPQNRLRSRIFKARAIAILGQMQQRNVRPEAFLKAERQAARQAEVAWRKVATGKNPQQALAAAYQAKEQQVLNHHLYMEARNWQKKMDRMRQRMRDYERPKVRQKIGTPHIEQIDSILEDYDFKVRTQKDVQNYVNLAAYIQMMDEQGRLPELNLDPRVVARANAKHFSRLTVDELNGIFDSIINLENMGRRKNDVVTRRRIRELGEMVMRLSDKMIRTQGVKDDPEGLRRRGKQAVNLLSRIDTVMVRLDGGEEMGDWYDAIKRDVDEAQSEEQGRSVQMMEEISQIFSDFFTPAEMRAFTKEMPIEGTDGVWTKEQILALALNTGTESNFQRLMDPKVNPKQRMTEPRLDALLRTLSERDWQFVQKVWDYIDGYYPEIAEVETRRSGVAPTKVQAMPMWKGAPAFVRGGYYRLYYDPKMSARASKDESSTFDQQNSGGWGARAQVNNGMTKQRQLTAGGRAVDLKLNNMTRQLRESIRLITMSEAVDATARILEHPEIFNAMQVTGNDDTLRTLKLWIKDVANGPIYNADLANTLARTVKNNFTLSRLAFNTKTVILQLTGLSQSSVTIGTLPLLKGFMRYGRGVSFTGDGIVTEVTSKSAFMKERSTTFQKDVYDFFESGKVNSQFANRWTKAKEGFARLGFAPIQLTQFYGVDMPTWIGAYDKALSEGKSEADAINFADRMVARSQDSGFMGDRAAIERGTVSETTRQSDVVRIFTTLAGYMLTKLNRANVQILKAELGIRTADNTAAKAAVAAKLAMDMMVLFMVEPLAMALMYAALSDEDEPEDILEFIAWETGASTIAGIPVFRDILGDTQGYTSGGVYGAATNSFGSMFQQLAQGELDEAFARSALNLTGLMTGLPSTTSYRILEQFMGDDDPSISEALIGSNPLTR